MIAPSVKQNMPSSEEILSINPPYFHDFLQRRYILPGFALIFSAILGMIVPWCLVHVIDQGITEANYMRLSLWLGGAALAQASAGILRFWGTCRISRSAIELEKNRLIASHHQILHADLRALPDISHGSAIGQMLFAAHSERQFIEILYIQGIPLFITALGTVVALTALSPGLALVSLGLLPFAAILWFWMKRRIRPATRKDYENQESMYRHLVDIFRAIIPIRALHQTDKFSQQYREIAQSCEASSYHLTVKLGVQGPFFDVLQAVTLAVIFGMGGYWTISGAFSMGALLGFQLYLARLFGLLRGSTGIYGAWQHYIEGRARAQTLESLPLAPDPIFYTAEAGEVLRLEQVSFAFGAEKIWDKKSLVIHEGEKHAILLPSGGGKTTLARCILGLYPISEGRIMLPHASSACIGFVPQENVLFDGTLRENMSLTCEKLEDTQFERLLYLCGLEALSDRIQSESIGEQGSRLSGGEQRRVMLARALASNPKLLIIDQMASELEPELCQTIFSRIHAHMPQLGILYLGHRLPEWDTN